jgi:hypothetical protein
LPEAPSAAPRVSSYATRSPAELNNSQGRQRSSASRARTTQESPPPPDLYQLSRQALDDTSPFDKQQRAWRSIKRFVASDSVALDSWVGPDTPLIGAVQADSQLFAALLLQARANVQATDNRGNSPLHCAALKGSSDMCKALLKARADVNARSSSGDTPIFSASSADICRLLVERGANLSALNEDGQSALHLAAKSGHSGVFAWLSAKATRSLCQLEDNNGVTPADLAEQAGMPLPGFAPATTSGFPRSPRATPESALRQGMTWPQQRSSRHDTSPRSLRQANRQDVSPSRSSAQAEGDWHPAMPRLLQTHDQLLRQLSTQAKTNDLPML